MNDSSYPYKPYWYDAFPEAQKNLWASHKMWGDTASIESLASFAMLTAFFDNSVDQIEQRRNLLYHYLLGPFEDNKEDDALRMFRRTLPVTTWIPKVIQNLCVAYNQSPTRTWNKPGSETEEKTGTELLRKVYKQMRADGRLQVAYRYAKLCSGVAIGVYVGRRGRLQIEILTPDLFRFETPTLFPDEITYFTRPLIERKGDKRRTVFQVWTSEKMYYTDCTGEVTEYWDSELGEYSPEGGIDNPYGRVPYIVCRLIEPNTLETFGAGLFDIVEGNIVANKHQWMADSSITYEAFGHYLGVNLGIGEGRVKMGFGRGTFVEGIESSGEMAPPSLDVVSNNGQYDRMLEFRDNYVEALQRGLGLPQSVYAKNSGAPPSGIARKLERLELLEQRDSDIDLLKLFEQEFSDLVTLVYNTDVATTPGFKAIPEGLDINVQFEEEGILDEPAAAFDRDLKALLAGVILPSRFVRDHAGKEVASEKEAIDYILTNQKLLESVRAGLNGGTPTKEPTDRAQGTVEPDPAPPTPGGLIPPAEEVIDAQEDIIEEE